MNIVWGRSLGWNIELNKMEITEEFHGGPDCYPWREVYAWLPVKTIAGKYVWRKEIYKRKIWVTYGHSFHMEPIVQYATMFDIIKDSDVQSLGR